MPEHSLEPNPIGGRALSVGFYNDLASYYEWLASQGRAPALLPGGCDGLPRLVAPEVIEMRSIRAIGERGYLIHADEAAGTGQIDRLDLASLELPVGRAYRVYACLTAKKTPCGSISEDPPSDGRSNPVRYRQYRRSKVVLAVNDDHRDHRDWIQVASFSIDRRAGRVVTILDESFHPPIASMTAYQKPNPLGRMADLLLDELRQAEDGDRLQLVKTELNILRNIAETASAELVFAQTQRALGLLVGSGDLACTLKGKLLNYTYDPYSFGQFLDQLDRLLGKPFGEPYPTLLKLPADDGPGKTTDYKRLSGEFVEEEDYWVWRSRRRGFRANGVAVLFPAAQPGDLQTITYGPKDFKTLGDFGYSQAATDLSHSGVVMRLDAPSDPLDELWICVASESDRNKLRVWLKDGHALYYW